jgi:hypothetical protein
MLHKTAAEHYEKLKRLTERLEAEVHKDVLDDFFKTAYHLAEWTKKDPTTTDEQKAQVVQLWNDADFQTCRDICNKQKHYTLNYTPRVKGATPAAAAYGVGRYGKADYSHGEQSVMIHFADGSSRNALDIVRAVAAKWSAIF